MSDTETETDGIEPLALRARNAALEEAAKACDAIARKGRHDQTHKPHRDDRFKGTVGEVYGNEALAAEDCAKAIRALVSR